MSKLKGNPYYCHLNKPQPAATVGKKVFKASFGLQLGLDENQQKVAKKLGLKLYPPTEAIPQTYVKFTSIVEEKNHEELTIVPGGRRPVIYGPTKERLQYAPAMTPESVVNVIFDTRDYDGDVKALIRAVQVLSVVRPEGLVGGDLASNIEEELEEGEPLELPSNSDDNGDDDELDDSGDLNDL